MLKRQLSTMNRSSNSKKCFYLSMDTCMTHWPIVSILSIFLWSNIIRSTAFVDHWWSNDVWLLKFPFVFWIKRGEHFFFLRLNTLMNGLKIYIWMVLSYKYVPAVKSELFFFLQFYLNDTLWTRDILTFNIL